MWTTCSVLVPDVQLRLHRCLQRAGFENAALLRDGKEPEGYNTGNSASDTQLFYINIQIFL